MPYMSKHQATSFGYDEIERLVQRGRIERSKAFRKSLSDLAGGLRTAWNDLVPANKSALVR